MGAIAGPAVARGVSFLKDKLGQAVFSPAVTLTDDPFRRRGLGSAAFDDEGVEVVQRNLVQDGVVTTWLLNSSVPLASSAWRPPGTPRAGSPGRRACRRTTSPSSRAPRRWSS